MVYRHRPTTPSWLYKVPNLDPVKLPVIQKELIQAFEDSKQLSLVPYTSTYFETNFRITKKCPTLHRELARLNLLKNFTSVAFISVVQDADFPAHVDGPDDIGLNIPLINCQGTYTVWYDGKITDDWAEDYLIGVANARNASKADPTSLVEICRIESNAPYWINVNIIHKPVTTHNNFRVAASLRFIPEPLDSQGNLWPNLIKG